MEIIGSIIVLTLIIFIGNRLQKAYDELIQRLNKIEQKLNTLSRDGGD